MSSDSLFHSMPELKVNNLGEAKNAGRTNQRLQNVVFPVRNALTFRELLPLMQRIKNFAELTPVVILTQKFESYAEVLASSRNEGFTVVEAVKALRPPGENTRGRFRLFVRYINESIEASRLAQKLSGKLVVGMPPLWGFETFLCRHYLRENHSLVAVPCEDFLQSDADADAVAKPHQLRSASLFNRLTIQLLPAYASASGRSLSVSAWGVWIALITRASYTSNWWYQNRLIKFAIGNPFFLDQLESKFGRQQSYFLTGKPSQDLMAAVLKNVPEQRRMLLSQHGLDATKQLIVFALPQWAEEGSLNWKDHFIELEAICLELSSVGANIFVSIHPRSNPEHYETMLSRFGMVYSNLPITQLIPLCDTYLCGASTTARQALIAGKQVVILGFPLDYPSFRELPVGYARNLHEITPLIRASFGKANDLSLLLLDGHATEKIMALCLSIAEL
jgi:hypothetical protein